MITYRNVLPGEQATRGWWRVSIREGFDILGKTWPVKVELWRTRVNAGEAGFPAVASPAAASPDPVFGSGQAVVDVHVLGADQGDSVSKLAEQLDSLVRGVDVTEIQRIENSDPIGRSATLQQNVEDAERANPIDKLTRLLGAIVSLAVVAGVAYVGITLYKASKRK